MYYSMQDIIKRTRQKRAVFQTFFLFLYKIKHIGFIVIRTLLKLFFPTHNQVHECRFRHQPLFQACLSCFMWWKRLILNCLNKFLPSTTTILCAWIHCVSRIPFDWWMNGPQKKKDFECSYISTNKSVYVSFFSRKLENTSKPSVCVRVSVPVYIVTGKKQGEHSLNGVKCLSDHQAWPIFRNCLTFRCAHRSPLHSFLDTDTTE